MSCLETSSLEQLLLTSLPLLFPFFLPPPSVSSVQVSKQGDVEFIREVELLSRVHHRHLVNLIGFCAEKGERALIYEYMAMGSLYEHLHGEMRWDDGLVLVDME